jgi:aromatic ring-opening dioxygenase LigB subunit
LPSSLGLGARLLDQAGYAGPRVLQSVGHDEPVATCLELGAEISNISDRVALLVMADGTARRSPRAPGHFDGRAAAFDAEVERAVRSGDLNALRAVDQGLARDLLAAGRPAWQVLAGAMGGRVRDVDVLYAADPFGVAYLVACLTGTALNTS